MTGDKFAAFSASVRAEYQSQIMRSGASREVAVAKTEADFAALLPDGLATPGHLFLSATDGSEGEVGVLWLAVPPVPAEPDSAWIYDVFVEERHRSQGYGRALMLAAEDECRSRGLTSLGLNVFGGNDAAIRLYHSLGYAVTAQQMRKDVR